MAEQQDTAASDYILKRDFLASVRLNLLHYVTKEELGYLLHPSIPQCNANTAICDVGTGTGAWLVDLAKKSSSSTVYGFDIDISQAPPKEWLPSNVTIDTLDIFNPIPESLVGKFDIVHVQLFMCVVKDNDPQPVLRQISKLLKPGGYLQWLELDLATCSFHKATESLSTDKLVAANAFQHKLASNDIRFSPKWVSTLADSFSDAGLQVIANDWQGYSPPHMPIFTDTAFMTWYEFAGRLKGEQRDEFRKLLQEAADEVSTSRRATAVTVDNHIVVGRKGFE